MSDSSNDEPISPADPASTGATPPREGDAEESSWLEVEAELSRPLATGEGTEPVPRKPTRTVDPASPLMMVETAFLASAASLIWLINFYFPVGPLLRIFFPIPIALIYLRWNSRAAWMGALVSGLLLSVLMGPPRSILFVMPFGLMGVLLGVLWRRNAPWSISVSIAGLLGAIGFFFRIWLTSLLLGEDLWAYATVQVTELLEWLFVKLGLLIQPSLWAVQLMVIVMTLLSNVVYLFVVHLVAWLLLDRLGSPIPRPPRWVQVLMDYE